MLLMRCSCLRALPPQLGAAWRFAPTRLSLRYCGLHVRIPVQRIGMSVQFCPFVHDAHMSKTVARLAREQEGIYKMLFMRLAVVT